MNLAECKGQRIDLLNALVKGGHLVSPPRRTHLSVPFYASFSDRDEGIAMREEKSGERGSLKLGRG